MKVAIYHDYLNQYGGGERVLESICDLFPQADIYTLFYDKKALPQFRNRKIKTSIAQYFPFVSRFYTFYFWCFPFLVEKFNFSSYDLVISCTHAWGNGINKRKGKMLVYCHTPMRYFWDLHDDYKREKWIPSLFRGVFSWSRDWICKWDKEHAQKADMFVANSKNVAERIKANFEKESVVLHPPIRHEFLGEYPFVERKDYYLLVTRLKPYKKVDVVIRAFNQMKKRLIVIGSGPLEKELKELAGSTIEFQKNISDLDLRKLMAEAKGYVFMAHEDFGMTMAESLAAGTPVVAYGRGGACEIVQEPETGILFQDQTEEALIEAITEFEVRKWDREKLKVSASKYSEHLFNKRLTDLAEQLA